MKYTGDGLEFFFLSQFISEPHVDFLPLYHITFAMVRLEGIRSPFRYKVGSKHTRIFN